MTNIKDPQCQLRRGIEWDEMGFMNFHTLEDSKAVATHFVGPCSLLLKTTPTAAAEGDVEATTTQKTTKIDHSTLPEDIVHNVAAFLPLKSLLSLNATCSFYRRVTNQPSFWRPRYVSLAREKQITSPAVLSLGGGDDPKEAMRLAHEDRDRQWITEAELTGLTWSFTFKESAGADWTSWDPYRRSAGRECRRLVFRRGGTVMQVADEDDEGGDVVEEEEGCEGCEDVRNVATGKGPGKRPSADNKDQGDGDGDGDGDGGAPAAKRLRLDGARATNASARRDVNGSQEGRRGEHPSATTSTHQDAPHEDFHDDAQTMSQRRRRLRRVFSDEPNIPRIDMSWRFVTHPLDFPRHDHPGGYLRLVVGGREVPTYVVRRLSDGNWGFVMESCWGIFASFEVGPDDRFNEWDVVTTDRQWREAMLYNNGASVLPEGR